MRFFLLLFFASLVSAQITQQTFEAKDLKDLPVVSRFTGATLLDGNEVSYAEVEFPSPQGTKDPFIPQGKLSWRTYVAPEARSPIEVYRNYESALKQAGFAIKLTCTPQACLWRSYSKPEAYTNRIVALAPSKRLIVSYANQSVPPTDLISSGNAAGLLASRVLNGATQHLLLVIGAKTTNASVTLPDKKTTLRDLGERTYIFVALIEEKAPELGNVQVFDSAAIKTKLASEGKIAFYALYFDTGKSDLKPESKPQLDSMAEVLKSNPAFNVYIVGHTDTVGDLNMNLDLSRRRAQSVATALTNT
ncbi:MAG: OmpA family protein [Acidobacteria bacterium]|nr:OmpA family protein [Acidobacteriota bacterium]